MAAFKNKQHKNIVQKEVPNGRRIIDGGDPSQFYKENPAWTFANADKQMWSFSPEHVGDMFWTEIFPKLTALETQTWNEILLQSKKQNHSLAPEDLNKIARDRLADHYIELDAIISLRLMGTHRLYGYMTGRVFNILWYDDDHGDNDTCVCRSKLKHT